MKLYAGIDLHANNSVVVVSDEADRVLYQKRLRNELDEILRAFVPYHDTLEGIVVESTYNWYWLVDGLMAASYWVHLANTTAIEQYKGLKHTDDESDARWLAHLLRLGNLTRRVYLSQRRTGGAGFMTQAQSIGAPTDEQSGEYSEFAHPEHEELPQWQSDQATH